jgi:hypothetical protein
VVNRGGEALVQTAVTNPKPDSVSKDVIGDLLDDYNLSDTFDEMFSTRPGP